MTASRPGQWCDSVCEIGLDSELMISLIKETQRWSKDMSNFLITFNGVGAAMSYSTIFRCLCLWSCCSYAELLYDSANRGSLAIVSWAFALFCMAFLVPIVFQCLLGWAAAMPSTTHFSSRKKYNVFVGAMILFSFTSTIIAVYLLLLSVFFLRDASLNLGHVLPSSAMQWSSASAISLLSFCCLFILLSNLMILWGNGWENFVQTHCHTKSQGKDYGLGDESEFPWY